jgi:hypothetical protein
MTKTNVKMEKFIANLMRNFIGVSSSEEFQEVGAGKARVLEDNTLEFLMAEHKGIQVIQSIPFSDYKNYPWRAKPNLEKRFEELSATFVGELHYRTPAFDFFRDVFYYMLMFLSREVSSVPEQKINEIVNDKIIKYLTNNPDVKLDCVTSLYKDFYKQVNDFYIEYENMFSDWDDMDYVETVIQNCSSFLHLLMAFKELDVDVELNSEFKKNENSSGNTRIVTVELELPSGNKLVFRKGEGKLKKANYHDILLIISDELSLDKVLKNIKLKSYENDKLAYNDLSKDFTFIQELQQKIEKLLGL